jgi:hypothetical protein
MVEPRQATDDSMAHFACQITKAADTLRMCNTAFPWQAVVVRTSLSVTLYILCLS